LTQPVISYYQNAVKVAARYLHKRGGVMIGDVVGLGKTITATALAKIFEDDFGYQTLIICPPNLQEMWNDYKWEYGLRAEVMSMGEVQNKLKNTRPFRIVIIDESHNLRNREGRRYRAILVAGNLFYILLSTNLISLKDAEESRILCIP
jgi:SNF2 family DNA or RNA helicase